MLLLFHCHLLQFNMDQCQQEVENMEAVVNFDLRHLPSPDEAMKTVKVVYQYPPIKEEEYKCDHIDPSIYQRRGVLVQVCNTNASAHATIIGGIRLAIEDIRIVPAYLQRYRVNIKKVAIRMLNRHFHESQCSAGLHESLSIDDYGMTFMVATVTDEAREFNPAGRKEGPLFYCIMPEMLKPTVFLRNQDGTYQTGHIINLYIHLLPPHHRRVVLAKKPALKLEVEAGEGPNIKKSRPSYEVRDPRLQQDRPYPDNRQYDARRPYTDTRQLASKVAELEQKVTNATLATAFPPLPANSKGPTWNTDDSEELPEN